MADAKSIQKVREITGAGIVECKRALDEASGDIEQAVDLLRKQGQKVAANKQSRETHEGVVHAYIHPNGKVGVLVELVCETDFVARTQQFTELAHNIALQVAASNPLYLHEKDVPANVLLREREVYQSQIADSSKPKEILDKIIEGKMKKFYQDACLYSQTYIKDESLVIDELIKQTIAATGENIQVKRFARFAL